MISVQGSKVSVLELLREVNEYFELGALVGAGDTVIDVGANIGAFSLKVAEKCQSDVSLFCFEPSPKTYETLKVNFETNPLLRKTRYAIFPIGLTSPEHSGAECSFFNFRRFPTNSTFDISTKRREFEIFFEDRSQRFGKWIQNRIYPKLVGHWVGLSLESFIGFLAKTTVAWWLIRQVMGVEETKVHLDTLDHIIKKNNIERIDLLKIDVEGLELNVLQGLSADSWALVKQVVVETHDLAGHQTRITHLLRSQGFTAIHSTNQKVHDNGINSVLLLADRQISIEEGTSIAGQSTPQDFDSLYLS
jgi:FkbM family methyltransferase